MAALSFVGAALPFAPDCQQHKMQQTEHALTPNLYLPKVTHKCLSFLRAGVLYFGLFLGAPRETQQLSAVKQRGRERKGSPEIIQKLRLRNWPVSSADFPMTPMQGTEHHFGPF